MKKWALVIMMVVSIGLMSGCISGDGEEQTSTAPPTTTAAPTTKAPTTEPPTTSPPTTTNPPPGDVKEPVALGLVDWQYYDDAVSALREEGNHILLYFWRDQCPWCVAMDDNTFSDPDVVTYIEENFHPVEVDIWSSEPMSAMDPTVTGVSLGNLFKLGGVSPAYGFINPEENILLPMPGYMDAEQFLLFLEYISSNSYKDMRFQEYLDSL